MSNDDLFEDNDVVVDEQTYSEEVSTEKEESGAFNNSELSKILSKVLDKLKDVNQFSFSLFSVMYNDFMNLPKYVVGNYYSDNAITTIALYKSTLGDYGVDVLSYLYDIQRKIQIIGFRHNYAFALLQLLNENSEGELNDSFLIYFKTNIQKEVILNELYLNKLLATYQNYCELNDIQVDSCLIEHQLKSYMSNVEKKEYGTILKAREIESIGVMDNFLDQRNNMIEEITQSVFRFINQVQSAIDKIKIDAER